MGIAQRLRHPGAGTGKPGSSHALIRLTYWSGVGNGFAAWPVAGFAGAGYGHELLACALIQVIALPGTVGENRCE